jgi:ribosomal protein S2
MALYVLLFKTVRQSVKRLADLTELQSSAVRSTSAARRKRTMLRREMDNLRA